MRSNLPLRLVAAAALLAPAASRAQTYVLTDLGASDELASFATGLNSNGVVVGYSVHADGMTNRAWRWTDDAGRIYLGGFGGLEARALGLNPSGSVIGHATDSGGVAHAFVWTEGGGLADIGAPPGGGALFPQGINRRGDVTGYLTTTNGTVPFFWPGSGAPLPLPLLAGARAIHGELLSMAARCNFHTAS